MRRLVAALLLLGAGAGQADPLPATDCRKLADERAALVRLGAETALRQGPDAAKSAGGEAAIGRVMRLIEVDDQLAFRCTGPAAPSLADDLPLPPLPSAAGAAMPPTAPAAPPATTR